MWTEQIPCFIHTVWKVFVFGVILVRFSCIRTECEEILRISPYSIQMRENTDQINSRLV